MKWMALIFAAFIVYLVIAAGLGRLPATLTYFAGLPGGDHLGHFLLMGGLNFFINAALAKKGDPSPWRGIALRSVALLLIITLEECSQLLLSFRGFSWLDLAADYAGVGLFGFLAYLYVTKTRKKSPPP